MLQKASASIYTANCLDGINITNWEEQSHPASRATRAVDHSTRLLLVSVNKKVDDRTLRQTLARWMHEGIDRNGVVYRLLGYTESQVKAGKLMFFREGEGWTVERLLEGFGDLLAVYLKSGYGKYAARLGLSFSSTVHSLDIPHECAVEIPDILAPDGSLHSDGCGMIRDSFATQVCARHALPPDTTVFQVRRGGIKGLLVRYPDEKFDRHCRKHPQARSGHFMIAYRPSMFKYEGGPTVLELNNHNYPPPAARLNVQFMALLLTLGVPFEVFERLVQDQLDLIANILTDRESAFRYIKGELDAAAEDEFLQGLYAMLLARQDLNEPHVRHRLLAFQNKQYNTLRNKMSLRIHESAYLFGVVDEEGVLGPDEVFVNLPSWSGVLVRDVIVARNPCYHPGDFRKLRAVDHPSLRHHRNCIVFSATAPHSVPDTIASGDLDGDMYFVCWDPSLIPAREAAPFSRTPSATAAPPAGAARRLSDMPQAAIDTFMQLKFSRLLGMMSNEWTRNVELTPQLADAPHCRDLVPLIESALDIMKSGEDSVRLERRFKALRSRHSNANASGYKGPIQRLRDMIPEGTVEQLKCLSTRQDPALILRDEDPSRWKYHVSEAAKVLPKFNKELSEAIKLDKEDAANFDSASQHSQDRDLPRRADRVKQLYQSQYFGGGTNGVRCEQRMRASAWYYYGYTRDAPALAWLGERYLNEIKAWWSNGNRPPLFVGAAVARPVASFSQGDSQATLLDCPASSHQISASKIDDEVPMDIDSETIPDQDQPATKNRAPVDCRARRRRAPHDDTAETRGDQSRRCTLGRVERVQGVSATANPKPRAPVATKVSIAPTVCATAAHEWSIISSNGFARRYLCACGIEVREKKEKGFWISVQYTIAEPREPGRTPRRPRRAAPEPEEEEPDEGDPPARRRRASSLSTVREESVQDDGDSSDSDSDSDMSVYHSADEHTPQMPAEELPVRSPPIPPRRPSADRTSGGTTASDAPSSLCGFAVRRLPARPGSDISTPIGRPRQVSSSSRGTNSRRTSGATAASRTPASPRAELRVSPSPSPAYSPAIVPDWPLVSQNPKPLAPVATPFMPRCSSGTVHNWKRWGNQTHRRYTCLDCNHVVKERKTGFPEVWVPAN